MLPVHMRRLEILVHLKGPWETKTMKFPEELLSWYEKNHRPLPWRETKDPYAIWISEIMLQQTTVKAAEPYFLRFLEKFPNVKTLAEASIGEVYELWAGLGYYSRARNLHKAAIWISENHFPESYQDLLKLPGLGPYTARAIASFAFDQNVGVLDGNVIRVMSRFHDSPENWWTTKGRGVLQEKVDEFVVGQPSDINQALIELGATICSKSKPLCLLCPLKKGCMAQKNDTVSQRPLAKPKKPGLSLFWEAHLYRKNGRIKFVENDYAPFLKSQRLLPGTCKEVKTIPKKYDFVHSITKYKIYVQVRSKTGVGPEGKWLHEKQIGQSAPSSLVQKALKTCLTSKH